MLIGLHMIVKNGGEMLNHCLNSVRDLVDEIIIVDTGSEDQSISIAESFGAKILHTTWENNFSKARNLSIPHAKTDWIVYLDADEIFQGNARDLRERLRNSDREGYWIDVESLNGSLPYEKVVHQSLRLFRSKPNLYFKGAIHEDIIPSLLNHGSQLHSFDKLDAKLIHLGYLPELNQGNNKLHRNIHILEEALKQDIENHYYQYHLGVAYTQKGMCQEGIDLMAAGIKEFGFRPFLPPSDRKRSRSSMDHSGGLLWSAGVTGKRKKALPRLSRFVLFIRSLSFTQKRRRAGITDVPAGCPANSGKILRAGKWSGDIPLLDLDGGHCREVAGLFRCRAVLYEGPSRVSLLL